MADNNLSYIQAKWFKQQVERFPADKQAALINGTPAEVKQAYGSGAEILLDARNHWHQQLALDPKLQIFISHTEQRTPAKQGTPGVSTIGGLIGLGALAAMSPFNKQSYSELQESIKKQSENASELWEKEEERLKKNPLQKPDASRPATKEEAYERSEAETYDNVARISKNAKKWAADNPDNIPLAQAMDRLEIERKNLSYQEFQEIKARYINRASRRGRTVEEVVLLQAKAKSELNNILALHSNELARKWATENKDPELRKAVNDKIQREIEIAKEEQGRTSKLFGRDPIKKLEATLLPETDLQPKTYNEEIPVQGYQQPSQSEQNKDSIAAPPLPQRPIISQPPTSLPRATGGAGASRPNTRSLNPRKRSASSGTKSAIKNVKRVEKAVAIATNPITYIILGIIGIMLIVLFTLIATCQITNGTIFQDFLGDLCKGTGLNSGVPLPPDGVTIIKSGPTDKLPNPTSGGTTDIPYEIKIIYDADLAKEDRNSMTLVDNPDYEHSIVSATNPHSTRETAPNQQILWKFSDFDFVKDPDSNKYTYTFNLVTRTALVDSKVTNTAKVEGEGGLLNPPPTRTEFSKLIDVVRCTSTGDTSDAGCRAAGESDQRMVYDILSIPMRSDEYTRLLTTGHGKITAFLRPTLPVDTGDSCRFSGGANYPTSYTRINLWGYDGCGSDWQHLRQVTHESGHIIGGLNTDNIFGRFPLDKLASEDGSACYERGYQNKWYIKSYGHKHDGIGGGGEAESFAEAIGNTLVCGKGREEGPCSALFGDAEVIEDWPKTCKSTYDWVMNNIFKLDAAPPIN